MFMRCIYLTVNLNILICNITARPQLFRVDNSNATIVESAALEYEVKDACKLVFCTQRGAGKLSAVAL